MVWHWLDWELVVPHLLVPRKHETARRSDDAVLEGHSDETCYSPLCCDSLCSGRLFISQVVLYCAEARVAARATETAARTTLVFVELALRTDIGRPKLSG